MILSAIKLTGLLILTGGPLVYVLICRSLEGTSFVENLHRKFGRIILFSGGLYLFSLLVSVCLAYITEVEFTLSLEYLNLLLVPVFIGCVLKAISMRKTYLYVSSLLLGLVVLAIHATTSHAAGQAGLFSIASNLTHLIVAAILSGGLVTFSYLTSTTLKGHAEDCKSVLQKLALRSSILIMISLLILLISGAILTVSNVHSIAAVDGTLYGSGLKIKLVFVIFLFCLFIFDVLYSRPGINKLSDTNSVLADKLLGRFRKLVVFFIIVATGVMTTFIPPDTAPFLNPQTWAFNAGQYPIRIEMQPVAGSSNSVRFELFVPEESMQIPGMSINYDLYIKETSIGVRNAEAIQVSQNSFQGEATIPMPGSWRLELTLNQPEGGTLTGSYDFEIPSLPLVEDLKTYLSYSSITYNSSNKITFMVGVFLLIIYGSLAWRSQLENIPVWTSMVTMFGIIIGIYLVMSVSLVKTYPSTYWHNPQNYTAPSIDEGQTSYMEYCSECHGQTGRGDGVWALENRGFIPALSSPHMDVHTDGEIYWWITYGIQSLAMPPLEKELSVNKRWQIINYIRSLRHGIPD
jgi:putative copper export protein